MALSFGVKDYIEGGVLAFVIALNVTIGFVQELRAEKKMDSLRALSSPSAAVLRDGKVDVIPRFVSHPGKHDLEPFTNISKQWRGSSRRHLYFEDG